MFVDSENMKKLLNFLTITLLVRSNVSVDSVMKCKRLDGGQQSDNEIEENEITSTSDYLEFNNKVIEKVEAKKSEGKLNVDNSGNVYYQNGEKLFVETPSDKRPIEVAGINLLTNRTNEIFIDRHFNNTFVGTHNGLFLIYLGTRSAVKIGVTNDISVDFGIIDSHGNIYFGTDGSNTNLSEQLYVFRRQLNTLTKISGIETSLGSYPLESRGNGNKIAIDSKNNVYVGAYSNYVYLIKASGTSARKIKDNRDNGGVTAIVIDSKDNVYCRTYLELFIYKNSKFTKILETIGFFDLHLSVDNADNVYFKISGDEFVLKPKEITAIEIHGLTTKGEYEERNATNIVLNKNLMIRNNIFYFTIKDDGRETLCALEKGETNVTAIHSISEFASIAVDRDNNIFYIARIVEKDNNLVPYVLRSNAKAAIEIRGVTGRLINAYADNRNNIYFSASNGLHVLNFDEVVPHRLRATGSRIRSLVIADNDNVYFGTDYDGAFLLMNGATEATRINGINNQKGPLAVATFADKNYDVVYFEADDGVLYKSTSGDTDVNIVVDKGFHQFYLSDCRNNTYYVYGNDVFLMKSGESTANKIAIVIGHVLSMDIDSSGKLYFATQIGLQILNVDDTVTTLVTDSMYISALTIDDNDNVYFAMNDGAFVLRSGETQISKINGISGNVVKILVNVYDIYFITNTGNRLFLLQNKLELGKLFKNRMLGEIDDNKDETILNALNYLNSENNYILNRIKNKVVNRTETSATIVSVKGKYVGEFSVEFEIANRNADDRKFFVNIDILRRAIFFNYINEHLFHHEKTKEIKDIEVIIDNLRFNPVEASTHSISNTSVDFKTICDMKMVANSSPINQLIKFSECNYTGKQRVNFEIVTGINKPNEDPDKILLTPYDAVVVSDFLYDPETADKVRPLSSAFELSNLNSFKQETNLYDFVEPAQEIVVPPKRQILVKYSVRIVTNKIELNLLQKIQGVIVARVVDNSGEQIVQITLRNAMQVLDKFSQLPTEVRINDDNSITFDGKAILISRRESMPNVIRNFVDLNAAAKRT